MNCAYNCDLAQFFEDGKNFWVKPPYALLDPSLDYLPHSISTQQQNQTHIWNDFIKLVGKLRHEIVGI